MNIKSKKLQSTIITMSTTTRLFAFLIPLLMMLSACTEGTSSNDADKTIPAVENPAKTNTVRGGKTDPVKQKPRSFTLTASKYQLSLAERGGKPQTVSIKDQVAVLSFDGKGGPSLNPVKIPGKPVQFMGLNGPFFNKFSLDGLQLSIQSDESGRWKISGGAKGFSIAISPYECEDVYMTGNDGDLYLVAPPKPIVITLDGFNLNFLREGKSEGVDVPNADPVILATCDEVLLEPRSFVYQGGGLGTVILVDNIIDPDLVSAARSAGAGDPFQGDGAEAFMQDVKEADRRFKGQKCPSIDAIPWSKQPDITVVFTSPETKVTIYCDTWLVVEDGDQKRCFNIVTCGAKLELDGTMLNVYSGCPDDPSANCPN
jgi:hypothetical protein